MPLRTKALIALGIAAAAALAWHAFRPAGQQVTRLDPAQIVVLRTPGGMLEVSTVVRNEEFAWKTSYQCPLIDCSAILKPTISEIRLPVHYTYRIPLAETWSLTPSAGGHELRVPAEQPLVPPGPDFSRMEIRTSTGWFSPGTKENREALLRQLGPELARRAAQPHYIDAQRDAAQKTVLEFAAKWMREQGKAEAVHKEKLRVVFGGASIGAPPAAPQ